MSSRSGASGKSGPPAHQNKFAFKHNKGSEKTQKILSSPNTGLCQHCREVVEWRKAFRKYKPLTTPKRCVGCELKSITMAYHVLCDKCAKTREVCAKCMQSKDVIVVVKKTREMRDEEQRKEDVALELMSERQRRTYLRLKAQGRLDPDAPLPTRRSALGAGEDGDEDDEDDDFDDDFDEEAEDDGEGKKASSSKAASKPVAKGADAVADKIASTSLNDAKPKKEAEEADDDEFDEDMEDDEDDDEHEE